MGIVILHEELNQLGASITLAPQDRSKKNVSLRKRKVVLRNTTKWPSLFLGKGGNRQSTTNGLVRETAIGNGLFTMSRKNNRTRTVPLAPLFSRCLLVSWPVGTGTKTVNISAPSSITTRTPQCSPFNHEIPSYPWGGYVVWGDIRTLFCKECKDK